MSISLIPLSSDLLSLIYENITPNAVKGPELWKKINREAYAVDSDIAEILRRILSTNLNATPFRSIFRIAYRFGVNHVFLEKPYLDLEFWESFSSFYSKVFTDFEKDCVRIHFFRADDSVTSGVIIDFLKGKTAKPTSLEYIGFTSIRPTTSYNIGRTALSFDIRDGNTINANLTDDIDKNSMSFCSPSISNEANLLNQKLTVNTIPFIQQDPIIGVCASAAVWVCSQVVSQKFDISRPAYSDISRYAFENTDPFSAGKEYVRGLSIDEIRRAMSKAGTNPFFLMGGAGRLRKLRNTLYSLIESNIPCVICLQQFDNKANHAVASISHSLPNIILNDVALPSTAYSFSGQNLASQQYFVSDFIQRFYVHDDRYGPFNRLTFRDDMLHVYLGRNKDYLYDLKALVIPFPPYVKNLPDTIGDVCQRVMQNIFLPEFHSVNNNICVLWRVFLVKASDFKQSLLERGYSFALREKYASVHMSKFIWLSEFTLFDKTEKEETNDAILKNDRYRLIDGEFIFDATHPTYEAKSLCYRYSNLLIRKRLEIETEGSVIKEEFKNAVLSGEGGEARQRCFIHTTTA